MKPLIVETKFWPLFWTQFLGALNDNFLKNSLIILITYKNVSILGLDPHLLVAMAGGIFIFPFFIFSATAGQIADRFEKTVIIKITKVTELLIMVLAATGLLTNNYILLMFVLFLMGAQSAFFGPLKYGIIPHIVEKNQLISANAYIGGGTFLAILLGTLIGGTLANFDGSATLLSAGLIGLAILGVITSLSFKKIHNSNPAIKIDLTLFRPSFEVLKLVYKDKNIFKTIMGVSWFWFLGAGILSLLPVFCKDVLGGGGEVGTFFLGTFTIGMGVGSLLTNKLSKGRVELGMVAPAGLFLSLFMFDMFYASSRWGHDVSGNSLLNLADFFSQAGSFRILMDLFFVSVCGGMFIIPQMTYIQEASDTKELSRIISGNNIINAFFMVTASVLIMGMHTLKITVPAQFAILAGVNLIVSFVIYYLNSEVTLRFWFWLLSHTFYDLEIEGKENISKEGPLIICSNHVSYIDWWFIMAASPRPVRFVIDNQFYSLPTGKFWLSQAGLIPIATRKESQEVLDKALQNISKNIQSGSCLGLFPEGWISRDGKVRKFQPGVMKIVNKDPVTIVPISILGMWGSIFSYEGGKVLFKIPKSLRRKVKVIIGKPISPENYDSEKMRETIKNQLGSFV